MFQDGSGGEPTSLPTPGAMGCERTPPGNATQSGHTEDSPAQLTVTPGARGVPCSPTTVSPRLPGRRKGKTERGSERGSSLCPRPRKAAPRGGGCNALGWAGATFRPGPLQADPEPVAARRRGGSAPDRGRGSNRRQSPPRTGGRIRQPGMAGPRRGDEGERKASPATAPAAPDRESGAPRPRAHRQAIDVKTTLRQTYWLRSSSTHKPSDPPPRVVFVFGLSRSDASLSWVTEGAGKTVENQASKVLSSSQGGQALGGEDQLRIFHRERAGQSRSPATRGHRPQADGMREATESLDLPPGGDRYLHQGFERTVTGPEPPDPRRRRDREAAAPAGGGRLDSRGMHQAVQDCIKLPQFQDHC
ncbi:UNVERIFIED_CONTAM: hypothetical protein FKN15_006744 [Acipenser sinensis]